jgi:hypothetical protein
MLRRRRRQSFEQNEDTAATLGLAFFGVPPNALPSFTLQIIGAQPREASQRDRSTAAQKTSIKQRQFPMTPRVYAGR